MKMKIQIMSDLHFEFHRDGGRSFLASLPKTDADAIVLAGDIIPAAEPGEDVKRIFQWFCSRYKEVFFVPGNHEYYGSEAEGAHRQIRNWMKYLSDSTKWLPLHVLQPFYIPTIGAQRFVGDTLWFPRPTYKVDKAKRGMNDFRFIKGIDPFVYDRHAEAVEWLTKIVSPGDIVVTHHMPSMHSVPLPYKDSPLNPFFVYDMEDLIMERKPALWIHGHTHTACDYMIGETRVIANPLGYPNEGSGFDEALVIEL